jgi:radical SAM superfamily enzyme YgiQ (UPF0313 family)
MKILLIYPPFCTPASPPYSITNLYAFLKHNTIHNIEILDLNIEFHKRKFPTFQEYFKEMQWEDYQQKTNEFIKVTKQTYSTNNKAVVNNELPEYFNNLLNVIKEKKPDIVACSIVYSSQAFYTYALLKELKKVSPNIKTIIGGPAINNKLKDAADHTLKNEAELLTLINKETNKEQQQTEQKEKNKSNFEFATDFSIYNLEDYFTPNPVIPLRTSSTCFYKQCTFCAHYNKTDYFEFPLSTIQKTIVQSKQKHFFLIDDMVPVKRLLELAEIMKPLNINWTCQLRPTKDFTKEVLQTLHNAGLQMIIWGVESGSQRILNLMKKGTTKEDVQKVLQDSNEAGITNVTYIMFGFPTETKEDFLETIDFLKQNSNNISLISSSIFGLQQGTPIYNDPEAYKITTIEESKRTILGPKIHYDISEGLTQKEASDLRKKYKQTLENINKYPKTMNFFREHMLCRITK